MTEATTAAAGAAAPPPVSVDIPVASTSSDDTSNDVKSPTGLSSLLNGRIQQPLEISIQDVRFSVEKLIPTTGKGPFARKETVEKKILDGITGTFKPGRLTAVMGASGAGKI